MNTPDDGGLFFKIREKIKGLKKEQLFILLLAGVLVAVIALPTSQKTEPKPEEDIQQTALADEAGASYASAMEQRLQQVLSHVSGVGKVEVMITLKSSGIIVVEKDHPTADTQTEELDKEGGKRTATEKNDDEMTVYEETADGEKTPYVNEKYEPKIQGVLVIAEGGGNAVTAQHISEAVMALFQIEIHKIKVMKMN